MHWIINICKNFKYLSECFLCIFKNSKNQNNLYKFSVKEGMEVSVVGEQLIVPQLMVDQHGRYNNAMI